MGNRRSFSLTAILVRLGLIFFGLFCFVQCFYFVQVLWFRFVDPEQSAFMAEQAKQVPMIKHHPVAYQRIAVHLKRAVIAAEDQRFEKHDGIDWEAIEKAWMHNRDKGRVVRGGSTITQQLAKNLFLSGERSYWRKAQEALITLMIEAVMDKQRILHLYLNYAEWGVGVFGAQAAAQHYFVFQPLSSMLIKRRVSLRCCHGLATTTNIAIRLFLPHEPNLFCAGCRKCSCLETLVPSDSRFVHQNAQ
jgi:monofunctional biosynthetic peptidoglycan transglycosylase